MVKGGRFTVDLLAEGMRERGERQPEVRRRSGEGKAERFAGEPAVQTRLEHHQGIVVGHEA